MKRDTRTNWGQMLVEQADQHGRYFFHVAFGILRDAASAEDACQQAMLQAWKHPQSLRDSERIRPWMTRIVVNECLQQLRRRKREREALVQQHHEQLSGYSVPEPGDGLADQEAVQLALAQLTEPTRTVVVLRLINGLSGNEVKDMLGCTATEVSRRLHEGMEQLRGHFAREGV